MIYYAIQNKQTKQFVAGSDFRYHPPHCRMADEWRTPLLLREFDLDYELRRRHINLKRYQVVRVRLMTIDEGRYTKSLIKDRRYDYDTGEKHHIGICPYCYKEMRLSDVE